MTATAPPRALDSSTSLAVDRTRLAHERTMMAWVRTATSLISFGFTIYKFFDLELRKSAPTSNSYIDARGFALIMIVSGLVALTLSSVQHYQSLAVMRAAYGPLPRSVAGVVAVFIAGLGLVALAAVTFRQ